MGLDTIEFILWSEKAFEIEIPDSEAVHIFTVGQFSNYVRNKLLDIHGTNAPSEADIFERIKKLLVSEFKTAPEKINRNSNFVKDLRLDR